MNYFVENPKNYIRKYNENKDVTNYTNEIKKLNNLNIELKHDNDKPPDYYQYNMKNKTIVDFRLDTYQNENNIKSNMTILKEENNSDKTIDEIKTNEDDFQTNLNLILNKYKNKQNYYNTTKKESDDNKLNIETEDINIKLDELTTDYKKLPVIYKTLTRPISEGEKIDKIIKSIFDNIKILNGQKDNLENKKKNMNFKQLKILETFANDLTDNNKIKEENIEKYLINFFNKTNEFIDTHMFIKDKKKTKKGNLINPPKKNDSLNILNILPKPPPKKKIIFELYYHQNKMIH